MCNNDSEFNTILQHLHNNQNPTAQNNNTFTSDYLQQRTASEKNRASLALKQSLKEQNLITNHRCKGMISSSSQVKCKEA